MNILFYYPSNKSSVSLESVMREFVNAGHNVYFLCWEPQGDIQKRIEGYGVQCESYPIEKNSSLKFYQKHLSFLRKFISANRIDIVYSHTQPTNFVAVFAQYVSRAKFYICRHHSDYMIEYRNKNGMLFDRIINKLGKRFIVPSKKVAKHMIEREGVNPNKIIHINYGYDFSLYKPPNQDEVERIRQKFPADILLVYIARFIECKRHGDVFQGIRQLIANGANVQLLLLGNGPLEGETRELAEELELGESVHFLGFKPNVTDYLDAADIIPMLSSSEASNNVIKEAGLLKKPVIVCNDVGDFDDYVFHKESGMVVDKQDPVPGFINAVQEIGENKDLSESLGQSLYKEVIKRFSIENVIRLYKPLNSKA